MNDDDSAAPLRLEGLKAGARKALIAFLVVDALFVLGVAALYVGVFRPQQVALERARDLALRANVAMAARVHAVEARAALRLGDFAAARQATRESTERLAELAHAIPHDAEAEIKEVGDIAARLELVRTEIDRDAETARRDLELAEARLAAAYPIPASHPVPAAP